ncbi:MerR family transcriptional regulator (plasmid) [Pseudoalteromonas xiamenensis]|uniref:MerR family transcriptional regulator n=1 Tax=Pseudoalteromonas xiamenensis TaxID=882626 RepID=UPI0027E45124|nr:MerR family transcriptional regulator [Pseudoalteromonas xiamenensis]WMN61792.1 MerR family transcriptional regulator [Pseudoalteromonas xiamenensis]
MLTVTQVAKKFGVSRTTILYYEKVKLLIPAYRSENGYRWYGQIEIKRLEAIIAYRSYGLTISNIKTLLDRNGETQTQILKDHFNELEREIQNLRAQQKAVVVLLQEPTLLEENIVNKERWVEIMIAAGFTETDMVRWHQKFEELEPSEHQKFLESLGISGDEITKIRAL